MKQYIDAKPGWFPRSLPLLVVVLVAATLAIPALAATNPGECSTNPANRQLDFWLGNWAVTYPGATPGATSTVSLDLDKCLIVENWNGDSGHSGRNMLAYSADDKSWHGMFADNEGRVHVFEGKVTSGLAEFQGPSVGPSGEAVLNRIKVIRETPDKLEQVWEKSTDKGANWKTVFQGEYSRRRS
jgi:hypothetical protein